MSSAEAALDWTLDYVRERKMFGQTLGDFQNTRFKLAELHAEVLAQRVFVDRCIELHLKGELDAVDAAAAKLVTTELQGKVMDECLQFFGGWGYMWEYPIARAFADARMSRVGGGTVEVMRQIIGNSLLPSRQGGLSSTAASRSADRSIQNLLAREKLIRYRSDPKRRTSPQRGNTRSGD